MPIIFTKGSQRRAIKPMAFDNEQELQRALAENPSLLVQDEEPSLALVQTEVGLTNAGELDILMVDATGYPVAVEVKLRRNIQSRREVVAQAFDYTSDLSQMTSDELDEQTSGNLERALLSFDAEPDKTQFESRWRACGANLRAGKVRLVIAVDEATEGLTRIVQYINDHSDLDVRLIVVQKFNDSDGSTLFVPTTVVHGGEKESPPSARAASRQQAEMTREFAETIRLYQEMATPELQPKPTSARIYRLMRFDNWPASLHYEFYETKDAIGVELHLESREVKPLAETLRGFVPRVEREFPGFRVVFDPSWQKFGRLRIFLPKTQEPKFIAAAMIRLIALTEKDLNAALLELPTTAATSAAQ